MAILTKISGTGSYLPEKILTNDDLSKMVDTSDEWIFQRVGIKQRHIADDSEVTSDLAANVAREALMNAHVDAADIDLIIPHQANVRIVEAAAKRLGIPKEKFYMNIDKYANTSAASIPIALDEAVSQNRIKKGDKIIMIGFGGGLTWGAVLYEW